MKVKNKVTSQSGSFQVSFKEVKVQEDGSVKIKGFASTPDIDRYDDIVKPEAFSGAMSLYMKNPVVLLGHNSDKVLGQVIEYNLSEKGLEITAVLTNDIDSTFKNITDKNLRGFSIGFLCKACTYREEQNKVIREITELDLIEISVVSTPANPSALFGLSKSLKLMFAEIEKKEAEDGVEVEEVEVEEEKEEEKETQTTEEENKEEEKQDEAPVEEQNKENPNDGGEDKSGESPENPQKEDDATTGAPADIVKADDKPTDTPAPAGISEEQVKALIAEAIKPLQELNETLASQNAELKNAIAELDKSHKILEKDVLSIAVNKGTSTSAEKKTVTWDILQKRK